MYQPLTRNHLNALLASLGLLLGSLGLEGAGRAETLSDKPYTVTVEPVKARKGEPATAQVVIKPAKGWHLNKEFPASLKLKPPAGVVAKKTELNKSDAVLSEAEGSFAVVLTGAEAGKKAVPGDLRFAVCSESSCDPQRSPVTIELTVQ